MDFRFVRAVGGEGPGEQPVYCGIFHLHHRASRRRQAGGVCHWTTAGLHQKESLMASIPHIKGPSADGQVSLQLGRGCAGQFWGCPARMLRRTVRWVVLILGCYYVATGFTSVLLLAFASTHVGVVRLASIPSRGGATNAPCVVWGPGMVFFPPPGDWDSVPREGDRVAVLAYSENYCAGTLKTGTALRRVWKRAAGLTALGASLLAGCYLSRRWPNAREIHLTQIV